MLVIAAPSAATQPEAALLAPPVEKAVRDAGGANILPGQSWVLTPTQIRVLAARGHPEGSYAMVAVFEQIG
jgi:hypothetical protein